MSSKAEDLPTPVSPTSKIVCRSFSLFLMIPFLRDATSLKDTVRTHPSMMFKKPYLIVGMLPPL